MQPGQPKVSILIPCFNAEKFVAAAIESALAQTWPSVEILVVNDGSTDQSGAVIDRYEKRGVKVLHQDNQGQSAAANRAFRESTGSYIKFFDADDLIHPDLIQRQMERLSGSVTAVASAEWGRFYGDDQSTFTLSRQSVWRDMDARDWLVEAWADARPMMQCALWLIPRPVLEQAGGWDERLSLINDFEFFARVLGHANGVRFAADAPVYYRSGISNSLSAQRSRRAVESACESLLLGTSHLMARRDDDRARRACANVLQDFIYTYFPDHADLGARIALRVEELGGSDLRADGSPRFRALRQIVGWKYARYFQQWIHRGRRRASL